MTDLFEEKAKDWDSREIPRMISAGVGRALLDNLPLTAELQVMDFGAGTGLVSCHVGPHVDKIYAVDISAAMLEKLVQKQELSGKVEAICQDIVETPLNRTFDLIISAMALHHVENTDQLLRRFYEHLKPGGRIGLADLDKEDGSFHPTGTEGIYHWGFDRNLLRERLQHTGFEEVRFSTAVEINRDNQKYPIFLMTARKP